MSPSRRAQALGNTYDGTAYIFNRRCGVNSPGKLGTDAIDPTPKKSTN